MRSSTVSLRMLLPTVALLLLVTACASAGGSSGTRVDYDVLTQQQLLDAPSDDLLTVIERLRPRWLQTRGQMSFSGSAPVQVILDGLIQPEGIGSLRAIRTNHVEEVHYMDARDATTQYGTDMASGAIIVTTKR